MSEWVEACSSGHCHGGAGVLSIQGVRVCDGRAKKGRGDEGGKWEVIPNSCTNTKKKERRLPDAVAGVKAAQR